MIEIILSGTIVNLTGKTLVEWVEVSGSHWPTGENHPATRTGWIHECRLSPDSVMVVELDPHTEPIGLFLSRCRGRSFRMVSRLCKSYFQSTGDLAGYVGRDMYEYLLFEF